jgi:hypothetical protein
MDDGDGFHLRLLLTSLPAAPAAAAAAADAADAAAAAGGSDAAAALALLARGEHAAALTLALRAALAVAPPAAAPESPPDWLAALAAAAARALGASPAGGADAPAARALLLAGVAALYLFARANLTGPAVALPECPFALLAAPGAEGEAGAGGAPSAPSEPAAGAAAAGAPGADSRSAGDRWAAARLAESGEDLVGLVQYPQYLVLALAVLADAPAAAAAAGAPPPPPAWAWWALRATALQQRALSARSATLRARLGALAPRVVEAFAPAARPAGRPPALHAALAASALLEAAGVEAAFGAAAEAGALLERAAAALGAEVALAGALGVRTVHQVDARAQLVARVRRRRGGAAGRSIEPEGLPAAELDAALGGGGGGAAAAAAGLAAAAPDVLPHVRLVEEGSAASAAAAAPSDDAFEDVPAEELTPLEQAFLLAHGAARRGTAADGLRPWEEAAFAAAALRAARAEALPRAAARLAAARLEARRSRTRERALLALEGLAEGLDAPSAAAPPAARLRGAFAAPFPLRVALRKELAEALVAAGLVGAALPIFEELELWDGLILCYRLLEKRAAAEALVRARLAAAPTDARLLCALGDITATEAHYAAAWAASGGRSARAARSLARGAAGRGDHAAAAARWAEALALNPLHAEGWFALGWARLKLGEDAGAARALTRAAQLDPGSGDAWNNLAAAHLRLGPRSRGAALAALTEAVRLKRDSWQTWENYAAAAAAAREWQGAARGLGEALRHSRGARLDVGVLGALLAEVERDTAAGLLAADSAGLEAVAEEAEAEAEAEAAPAAEPAGLSAEALGALLAGADLDGASDEDGAEAEAEAAEPPPAPPRAPAEAAALRAAVGAVLKAGAGAGAGGAELWALFARFHAAAGSAEAALECQLKRARALQGGEWMRETAAFEAYAAAAADLARAYFAAGGAREARAARLLLRGAVKGGAPRFEGHAALAELGELLAEAERRDPPAAPGAA